MRSLSFCLSIKRITIDGPIEHRIDSGYIESMQNVLLVLPTYVSDQVIRGVVVSTKKVIGKLGDWGGRVK